MEDATLTPELVRGVAEIETTPRGVTPHRLPRWVRRQFPDPQLMAMQAQPSGARLAFRTTARNVQLVTHPMRTAYTGLDRPRGRLDVYADGVLVVSDQLTGGDTHEVDLRNGSATSSTGEPHTLTFTLPVPEAGASALVEIWLPHNESIEIVSLRADAPLLPDSRTRPLWVHHGSSISQGSNAVAPSETWAAIAARAADVDLRNLGFGGSAMVDPFMARVIRDTAADVISVKLGINVVNLDAMHLRSFVPAVHGFLDTIRDAHPDTPLVLVSPLFAGIHEETPGPGAFDPAALAAGEVRFIATGNPDDAARGRPTLRTIRTALHEVIERRTDDPNLHFLEGTELFGERDTESLPLLDGLHPSPDAHRLIGERFGKRVWGPGGAFHGAR